MRDCEHVCSYAFYLQAIDSVQKEQDRILGRGKDETESRCDSVRPLEDEPQLLLSYVLPSLSQHMPHTFTDDSTGIVVGTIDPTELILISLLHMIVHQVLLNKRSPSQERRVMLT